MDAGENPEIAAALAKLAEQDAVAAEDARAALEWIAGEQGLALITQERITAGPRGEQPCWSEPWTTFSARTGNATHNPQHEAFRSSTRPYLARSRP